MKTLNFNPSCLPPAPDRLPWRRRFLRYWLPLLLLCAALFWQSGFPSVVGDNRFPFQDKLEHLLIFCAVTWLFVRALAQEKPGLSGAALLWIAVAFGAFCGFADEFHQAFVPSRQATLGDFAADVLGSILGAWFYLDIWPGRK